MEWKIRNHSKRHEIDGAVLSATEVAMFRPDGSSFIAYMVLGKRDDTEWCSVFFDDYFGHESSFLDLATAEEMIEKIKRCVNPHVGRYTTMGQINEHTFSDLRSNDQCG